MKTTLEQQRIEFANSKFLATPLSGLIAWFLNGISGLTFPYETTLQVFSCSFLFPFVSLVVLFHQSLNL